MKSGVLLIPKPHLKGKYEQLFKWENVVTEKDVFWNLLIIKYNACKSTSDWIRSDQEQTSWSP